MTKTIHATSRACRVAEHNKSNLGPSIVCLGPNAAVVIAPPAAGSFPCTAAWGVMAYYVFTTLPNASKMNAMIATKKAYVVTYAIVVNVPMIASTAITTESIKSHIDSA